MSATATIPTVEELEKAIGKPFAEWAHQCHAISLAILKTGLVGKGRIARGWCNGVRGQHSWIVLGEDCYDPKATIIDPTLWSYDPGVIGIWQGNYGFGRHKPHGMGSIWEAGKPQHTGRDTIILDREGLSDAACLFLDMVEPLDFGGWAELCNNAIEDWPAKEIITRIAERDETKHIPKIDIVGMVTDLNPSGLYY